MSFQAFVKAWFVSGFVVVLELVLLLSVMLLDCEGAGGLRMWKVRV